MFSHRFFLPFSTNPRRIVQPTVRAALLNVIALLICICSQTGYTKEESNRNATQQPIFIEEAIKHRTEGRTDQAILALVKIIAADKTNSRARLELAAALYQKQKYLLAARQIARVLQDQNLPNAVRKNSEQFMQLVLKKKTEADRFKHQTQQPPINKGHAAVIIGHDSNANVSPKDADLDIDPTGVTIAEDDNYRGLSLGYEHKSGLKKTLDKTSISAGFSLLLRDYEQLNYDLAIANGHSTLQHQHFPNWISRTKMAVDYIQFDQESLAYFYSLAPSLIFFKKKNSVTINTTYSQRDYKDRRFRGQQGHTLRAALQYNRRFNAKMSARTGLSATDINLNDNWRSYSSHRYSLAFVYQPNQSLSIISQIAQINSDYNAIEPGESERRSDHQFNASLGLNYSINNAWQINLNYAYSDRDSNINIRNYERHRYDISTRYNF